VLFHGAVPRSRVDPPGRAGRIGSGVSQPETVIGQRQPALVPWCLSRATAGEAPVSGGPGSSICPPGSTVTAVPGAAFPDHGRDGLDAFPGNGARDVVEVD
jgi:hypothetical protein